MMSNFNMKDAGMSKSVLLWGLAFAIATRTDAHTDCISVEETKEITEASEQCFCYTSGTVIRWKDIWSTFQVQVKGHSDISIVFPLEERSCEDPEKRIHVIRCAFNKYWPFPKTHNNTQMDIPLVDQEVCFKVKPVKPRVSYSVHVTGKKLNILLFAMFLCGLSLFYFAGRICRSTLFYYSAGLSVSVLSISIALVFLLKRFLPKGSTFLILLSTTSFSILGIQQLLTHRDEVLLMYWKYLLGYLLFSGSVSFAICYKLGPITDERTLTILSVALQTAGLLLIYSGISYLPATYVVFTGMAIIKCVPYAKTMTYWIGRQMWRLCGGLFNLFRRKKPAHRYLTEEEYRWQGEIHTRASLDALRQHCRTPGFPAWDTVLRLRAPQRFAGFLQGSSHITPTESQAHDRQYGVGGLFYEEIIYPAGGGTVPALEWNSSQRPSEDFSEDELEYNEPIQSPLALTPPVLAPAPAPAVLQTEDLELF
ncbi:nuclear envelope integral membrane protein 2 [Amia ocellicauda]|uniref:nuclear envelope integral membrane protein 2 n=1 Tax=Amia ocellicauda TaxID=2972642 RepID=UPI0034644E3B